MGIRKQQNEALKNTGQENIEFKVYDKDGVQKTNVIRDVLLQCPTTLRPINENLSVEYLRPLKKAIKETNINPIKLLNQNPTFRYGNFNWSITTIPRAQSNIPSGIIQPNQIYLTVMPISGVFCLYQGRPSINDDKTNPLIKNVLASTTAITERPIEINFSYHTIANKVEPVKSRFFISVGADTSGNGSIDLMYDFNDNKFTTGTFTQDQFFKIVEVTSYNKWNRYKTTLDNVSFGLANISAKLEVKLFPLSVNGFFDLSIGYTFIDNFYIAQTKDFKKLTHTKTAGGLLDFLNIGVSNNFTGEYKTSSNYLTNELDDDDLSNVAGDFGRIDRVEIQNDTLDKLQLQEILNDFRSPLKKYEGEFYRDDVSEIPIYFYHKIWVNFGDTVLQDFVSAMIDTMEYNVKANTFKLNMHLPNVGSEFEVNETEFQIFDANDNQNTDKFNFD